MDGPLSALPRWVGVYGTGAVAAVLAMALVQLRVLAQRPRLALVAAGVFGLLLGGAWFSQQQAQQQPGRAAVDVALLQGNIPQDEKFMPGSGVVQALQWYGEQLLQAPASLVVAPETALPMLPQQLPYGYLEALEQTYRAPESRSAALIGIPLGDSVQGYSNSVIGWVPGEMTEYRYDKQHLVPFGSSFLPCFTGLCA